MVVAVEARAPLCPPRFTHPLHLWTPSYPITVRDRIASGLHQKGGFNEGRRCSPAPRQTPRFLSQWNAVSCLWQSFCKLAGAKSQDAAKVATREFQKQESESAIDIAKIKCHVKFCTPFWSALHFRSSHFDHQNGLEQEGQGPASLTESHRKYVPGSQQGERASI